MESWIRRETERWRNLSYTTDTLERAILAHSDQPISEKKAVRKADGKTPYWTHPLWAATTITTEMVLPQKTRILGYHTLLLHDVLEDTTHDISDLPAPLVYEVEKMTFESFADETRRLWSRPPQTRLFKLYDKVSNLLDGTWMGKEKRQQYTKHTKRLAQDVEKHYDELNITRMARALLP